MPHLTEGFIVEETLPFFGLTGHCHFYEGISTSGFPAGPPTRILQVDQPCRVGVHCQTSGLLPYIMAGTWHCEVVLEKMGPGPDSSLGVITFPFESEPHEYYETMSIPAGTVPVGTYRAVATLTFRGPTGVPGPIACFADIGLLQFYEEGP